MGFDEKTWRKKGDDDALSAFVSKKKKQKTKQSSKNKESKPLSIEPIDDIELGTTKTELSTSETKFNNSENTMIVPRQRSPSDMMPIRSDIGNLPVITQKEQELLDIWDKLSGDPPTRESFAGDVITWGRDKFGWNVVDVYPYYNAQEIEIKPDGNKVLKNPKIAGKIVKIKLWLGKEENPVKTWYDIGEIDYEAVKNMALLSKMKKGAKIRPETEEGTGIFFEDPKLSYEVANDINNKIASAARTAATTAIARMIRKLSPNYKPEDLPIVEVESE